MNYYNEHEKKTAAWLRELIAAQLIPDGRVDERSIVDVRPGDLDGFVQCHFFAGIGGWSLALQLAGWPEDRRVWTGSCPCQPFSSAGKQRGTKDERHLWPVFAALIRERRPDVVFGEQVASAIGHGWLDGVRADLEREGYACGAAVLGAHSVGAPHIRQRLYWVADSNCDREEWSRSKEFVAMQTAKLAGWATPSSRDWKDTPGMSTTGTNPDGSIRKRLDQLPRQAALGIPSTSSTAPTEKRGALNPAHSRWLMGLPPEWCACAVMATRLSPRPPRSSSKRSAT